MLSKNQEKQIRALARKKERKEMDLCLVEGSKSIEAAGDAMLFVFSREDTPRFDQLVTTKTPQDIAGVAHIPHFSLNDVLERSIIVIADGLQDPGNVGAILRLCLGFHASLILVESADPTNTKVIRASAGALFNVPWIEMKEQEAIESIKKMNRPIFRMEKRDNAKPLHDIEPKTPLVLIVGSEGAGITLPIEGESIMIEQSQALESLNATHALAIVLYTISQQN